MIELCCCGHCTKGQYGSRLGLIVGGHNKRHWQTLVLDKSFDGASGWLAIPIPRKATFPVINAVKTFPRARKLIASTAPEETVSAASPDESYEGRAEFVV